MKKVINNLNIIALTTLIGILNNTVLGTLLLEDGTTYNEPSPFSKPVRIAVRVFALIVLIGMIVRFIKNKTSKDEIIKTVVVVIISIAILILLSEFFLMITTPTA